MRTLLILTAILAIVAPALAQEPPKTVPQPQPPVPAQPAPLGGPAPVAVPAYAPPNPNQLTILPVTATSKEGKVVLTVKKAISVQYEYTVKVPVTQTVTKDVDDGKGGKRTVAETVTTYFDQTRKGTKFVEAAEQQILTGDKNIEVTDASGKALTEDEVLRRLEKEAPVVFLYDANKPFGLKALKPDTIVITTKSVPAPVVPAVPMVAPKAPAPPAPAKSKDESDPSATEQDIIDLANAERKKAGAAPLIVSPLLIKAARLHSANMAKQGNLDHMLDGKGVGERLKDVGYTWSGCGENIALGQRTPAEAIESWMNSPGHRDNILSTASSQIGVAVVADTDGKKYWTMVLAQPR